MAQESSMPADLERAPTLSVVIAAWPDAGESGGCLQAVCPQCDDGTELIVVSPVAASAEMIGRFKAVRWLTASPDSLIPQLWSAGMIIAKGSVVAITTAQFEPAPDWIASIRRAHLRLEAAGIGGSVLPPQGLGATQWATYFLRYSNYLNCTREEQVAEIAGDNASYKRDALQAHSAAWRDGFWEPEFHALLHAEGKTLAFVPEIRVTQRAAFGIGPFCGQRLLHGRQFGRDRVQGASALLRLARIVTVPLIPAVLLGKIVWRVLKHGRHFGALLLCFPVLILFVLVWTLGEAWGYMTK